MSELNSYYEKYWEKQATEQWTPDAGKISNEENYLFKTYLNVGYSCLDYGCGNGLRYGHNLSSEQIKYCGFDISEQALKEAAVAGLDVKQLTSNGRTSLSSDSMDVAICFEVLEHLMEPDAALDEIKRCLKSGGHALISVPNAAFIVRRLEFLFTGFWCPGGSPLTSRGAPWRDPHIRFYHPAMLRKMATSCGFNVVEQFAEPFSWMGMPVLWRKTSWQSWLTKFSYPFAWLGKVFPGMFSSRLFIVIKKP